MYRHRGIIIEPEKSEATKEDRPHCQSQSAQQREEQLRRSQDFRKGGAGVRAQNFKPRPLINVKVEVQIVKENACS